MRDADTRSSPPAPAPASAPRVGPGRLLLGAYLLFVVAAGSRSGVQLATHPHRAPWAYGLSALAAVIYLAGFTLLALYRRRPGLRRACIACCAVELAGVVVVGTLSLCLPAAFPDASVWSHFGAGYGLVPLALPVLGILWLRRSCRSAAPSEPPRL